MHTLRAWIPSMQINEPSPYIFIVLDLNENKESPRYPYTALYQDERIQSAPIHSDWWNI